MSTIKTLQEMMPSLRLGSWAGSSIRKRLFGDESHSIETLCQMTMDSDGEYSSLLLAERILCLFEKLDEAGQDAFFHLLNDQYDLDVEGLKTALADYEDQSDAAGLAQLTKAAEPRRRELLRRLNLAPEGTARLVKMREILRDRTKIHPEFGRSDNDFKHLFNAWFNRGFLVMQPIDWTTPAHILEKIIAYEAVHEISNWRELRRRLEPKDRRCYAFFHPSMEDEPLVFVEVALSTDVLTNIADVLDKRHHQIDPEDASCAIFYSISNCHRGLAGVSFGNFLIKQVATSLKQRFPQLKTFATLSPAPGFRHWLQQHAAEDPTIAAMIERHNNQADEKTQAKLAQFASRYYLKEKTPRHEPLDPVARFHLKNGAKLDRINTNADLSEKGMQQSFGLMVNYVYNLTKVEENHEAYMKDHKIVCSTQVKKLLR